jgi:hypothetical protein
MGSKSFIRWIERFLTLLHGPGFRCIQGYRENGLGYKGFGDKWSNEFLLLLTMVQYSLIIKFLNPIMLQRESSYVGKFMSKMKNIHSVLSVDLMHL